MNHPGEIAPLARMADLDVAMVTIVAPAHLEAFENIEGIAREKASIFEGLREGGQAIINGDLGVTALLRDLAPDTVQSFGRNDASDWHLLDAEQAQHATVCRARHAGEAILFKVNAPGKHFAMNGLAALAACVAAGADLGQSVINLGQWQPPQGRGQRHFLPLDGSDETRGLDLIDDAYNANPASVGAALDVLAGTKPSLPQGRRIAVLGDMKELGPTEVELHAALARHDGLDALAMVHCVGPLMRHLHDALPTDKRGEWHETAAELAPEMRKLVHAGDVVMVKGSLSMKMALVVDAMTKLSQSGQAKREGHH